MKSPSLRASYSVSQSSPSMPECTRRTTVVPPARPSTTYSIAWNVPSGCGSPRYAKRVGGSQAVIVDVPPSCPRCRRRSAPCRRDGVRPRCPCRGTSRRCPFPSRSLPRPPRASPGTRSPCALRIHAACQASFGAVVGRSVRDGRVDGDEHAVGAPAFGPRVVVLGDQPGHGRRQLVRERRPIRRGGEPDFGIECEGRDPLAGQVPARDQRADVADQPGGEGQQPEGGQPVGRARRVGLDERKCGRGDHVRRRGGPHEPLVHVALATLLDELDETVSLERAQVVVDHLPGQSDAGGEGRRRGRLRPARTGVGSGPGSGRPRRRRGPR